MISLLPGECSSLGWMLWRVVSSQWKGSCDHPPLLSSQDVQAFFCCWAHQCVLFSKCTKLFIWPHLMFLLSLWWMFFLQANHGLFDMRAPLTACCGFTASFQMPQLKSTTFRPFTCLMGGQMPERLGNRGYQWEGWRFDSRPCKLRCVPGQGTSPYLPWGECPCTYCKSLWIRASAKWLNVM